MSRVTRKTLDNMVQRINELRGTDELVLDYQPVYGGYRLSYKYELCKTGKVSIFARNCDGRPRVGAREMEAFLSGILEVLTAQKYEADLKRYAEGGAQ